MSLGSSSLNGKKGLDRSLLSNIQPGSVDVDVLYRKATLLSPDFKDSDVVVLLHSTVRADQKLSTHNPTVASKSSRLRADVM